ncbi:hypothetical protein MLD38_017819 [Melastoma candidum]|uniref:Uncharacterized protein n=1 Tax=Melastoma candidum TaxID=119954 RepID=A0ACB9QRU9_9MYRT|nr:hypothetical protein MLD38_017819 [Melastoma candidum]
MDADSWSSRLSSATRRYHPALQSRSDFFSGFEEMDEDDIKEEFPCPFCSDYFDIIGLCCHIDDEHPTESKNGVCPVCAMRVGVDMVAHITLQHGNIFKISFPNSFYATNYTLTSLTSSNIQRKRKSRKAGSHSTLLLLKRELREGTLQSLFGGASCLVSSSNATPDPLLSSFMFPMNEDLGGSSSLVPSGVLSSKNSTDEVLSERDVQSSSPLSVKEQKERLKRSEFVRGLLLSAILDKGL